MGLFPQWRRWPSVGHSAGVGAFRATLKNLLRKFKEIQSQLTVTEGV
jgi:hypothetical protein